MWVIGLTGSFGSGCTTAAALLKRVQNGVEAVHLSDYVRNEWKKRHPKKKPVRADLQAAGDGLRRDNGLSHLVELALADFQTKGLSATVLVVDGIRNTGEIRWLRARFTDRFFLFAVDAPTQIRWERSKAEYQSTGVTEADFYLDDNRDRDEETPYGQQVQLCVDQADVLLLNQRQLTPARREKEFGEKVAGYVKLATGTTTRYPSSEETLMNIAYSSAHSTKCLKRQVGAVVVSASEREPLSIGYNENPSGTKPCIDEYGECYRDVLRNDHFAELARRETACPACRKPLAPVIGPPWRCSCGENLEPTFFPDRAMNWCTALHAEERALLNARGRDLHGAAVFTTTFPCFLCSEKIIHAGIERVVFTESYPDIRAAGRLELAGIIVQQFEGVRSSAFDRIFARARRNAEDEITRRRSEGL